MSLMMRLVIIGVIWTATNLHAEERMIRRDLNDDGVTDQIAAMDADGNIKRLEIDSDWDGTAESIQYYEKGNLTCAERDTDQDGAMDIRNHFVDGRRISQEKLSPNGNVVSVILFDENEKISKIKKDTGSNGRFDQCFFYKDGILTSSTTDTTGDGNVNLWQTFQDKRVVCQKTDENGDGLPEAEIFYNKSQVPDKSRHDLDNDGVFETLREYSNGALAVEKKDLNQDDLFDVTIEYLSDQVIVETRDADFDGIMDIKIHYKNGHRVSSDEDTDSDGTMDRTVFFDADENPEKIVLDTNADGAPDQWQGYCGGALEWFEDDRNHDGKPDLKIFYTNGEKNRLIKDDDFNGFFEISQRFDQEGWTVVVELDSDENNRINSICFYTGEVLERKDSDETGDGHVDVREFYDPNGRIIKSEEAVDGAGTLNMVWYYDPSQTPIRAEKDVNADGRPDIWYYYVDNRLTNIREDTDHDGKPDVWEEYDASEALIRRSKDLNFDGIPDIEEDFTQ